ncbi:MAG: hypothetical protein IJK19_03260 [Bacteroidales bacterium]|nr:hypothetical protein [Bacteroidales bacterium]
MKKIIYSLVAMLFMGGIITSCIEPFEPDGIKEERLAYARYLDRLGALKDADAEVQKAEAQFILAKAAVKQAIAAQEQAKADWQVLLNELKAAQNEEAMAALQAKMEEDALKHEATMAGLQAQLAEAQKNLADVLRALEIDGLRLSQEEQASINYIKANYEFYAGQLEKFYSDLADALKEEYKEVYDALYDGIIDAAEQPYLDAFLADKIAVKEQELANAEKAAEFWKNLTNDFVFDFIAQADTYKDSADALASEFADLLRDSVIYANTNLPILEKAIADAEKAFEEAAKEPKEAFDKAVEKIKGNVVAPKNINDTTVNDKGEYKDVAKAKDFKYGFKKKGYALPEHAEGDMVSLYEAYLGPWYNYLDPEVEFVQREPDKRDTLYVAIDEFAKKADYQLKVDSVWSGAQTSTSTLKMSTGLWSAYEDFGREYLYGKVAGIEADADVLEAYRDSVKAAYDSILNILQSAPANYADILLKAWYDKVAESAEGLDDLIKTVSDLVAVTGDDYNYDDSNVVSGHTFDGPAILYYKGFAMSPRKFAPASTTSETEFVTSDALANFFDDSSISVDDIAVSQGPLPADSLALFNAIKEFFTKVAAVNEDAVPYLKFMASKDGGLTYVVDKVRADKIEFSGLKTQQTNGYLKSKGLLQAALYDNKAINPADAEPNLAKYYDAMSNLIDLFAHFVDGVPALNDGLYDEDDADYSFEGSGLAEYFDWVQWYYDGNSEHSYGGHGANYGKKTFAYYRGFDSPEFEKYAPLSEEGQALQDWLEACYIYFGEDGFGGFGEKVFFTFKTFAEPTNAVVFRQIPEYFKDTEGNVIAVDLTTPELINRYSSQYGFIVNSIENNLKPFNDYSDHNYEYAVLEMDKEALVFQLFAAEYLVYIANNADSFDEVWEALGEVLKQVKADLDKVITDTDAKKAKSEEDAKAYNAALKDYRDAIRDALREKDAAIKAAQDAYDEGLKPIHDRFVEAWTDYNFYMKMYNDLCGAYALHAGAPFFGPGNPQGIIDYCLDMYEDWSKWAANLAGQIAEANIWLNGIQSEELDNIEEAYLAVVDILNGFAADEVADIEFWYEYWKAAYEAAIEYISNQE